MYAISDTHTEPGIVRDLLVTPSRTEEMRVQGFGRIRGIRVYKVHSERTACIAQT
jgi:hypothetical protein